MPSGLNKPTNVISHSLVNLSCKNVDQRTNENTKNSPKRGPIFKNEKGHINNVYQRTIPKHYTSTWKALKVSRLKRMP